MKIRRPPPPESSSHHRTGEFSILAGTSKLVEIVAPCRQGQGRGRRAAQGRRGAQRGEYVAAGKRHERMTEGGKAGSVAGCELLFSWPQAA